MKKPMLGATGFWGRLTALTYDDVDSLRLEKVEERFNLDYKGSLPAQEKLAETLCALANTGGGRLLVGAVTTESDHRIESFRPMDAEKLRSVMSRITNAAHLAQPPVQHDLKVIEVPGKAEFLVVVEVRDSGTGPHQFSGRYLHRVGPANVAMSHAAVVSGIEAARRLGNDDHRQGTWSGLTQEGGPLCRPANGWYLAVTMASDYPMPPLCDVRNPDSLSSVINAFRERSIDRYSVSRKGIECTKEGATMSLDFRGGGVVVKMLEHACRLEAIQSDARSWLRRLATILCSLEPGLIVSTRVGCLRMNVNPMSVSFNAGESAGERTGTIATTEPVEWPSVPIADIVDEEMWKVWADEFFRLLKIDAGYSLRIDEVD